MVFFSKREERLWLAAGLCIVLIYSSLSIARPIAEYLRHQNQLRLVVALVFTAVAGLIAWRLLRTRPGWRVLGVAGLIGVGYVALLAAMPMAPEERLHFLEYGVVAALIYFALRERQIGSGASSTRVSPLILAVAVTGAVGWIDEGIQALLPNRVYDNRDVVFNIVAALVCLLSLKLVERVRAGE